MDKRHLARIHTVQHLFTMSFDGVSLPPAARANKELAAIKKNLKKIDAIIQAHASRYPLEKIAKVDLSILRLAVWELALEQKKPPKVVIDEAVTLAHELGNEKSYSFINGVLGSIIKEISNS